MKYPYRAKPDILITFWQAQKRDQDSYRFSTVKSLSCPLRIVFIYIMRFTTQLPY